MCSSILDGQAAAMTTSLSSDICSRPKNETGFHHLHMAWILVADRRGNPRPQMHWLPD